MLEETESYITKQAEDLLYYFPTQNKDWIWLGIPCHLNQDGSLKHYTSRMVDYYFDKGEIAKGGVVVCSTSGNTGYAFVKNCARRKIIPLAIVDAHAPSIKLDKMRAYNGLVIVYDDTYRNLYKKLLEHIKKTEFLLQDFNIFPKDAVKNLIKKIKDPASDKTLVDVRSDKHLVHIRRFMTHDIVKELKKLGFSAMVLEQYDDIQNNHRFVDYGYKIAKKLGVPIDVFVATRGTGASSSGLFTGLAKYYREARVTRPLLTLVDLEDDTIISGPGFPEGPKKPANRRANPDLTINLKDKQFINLRLVMQARGVPFGDSTDAIKAALPEIAKKVGIWKKGKEGKKIGLFPIGDTVDDYSDTSGSIKFLNKHGLKADENLIKEYNKFYTGTSKMLNLNNSKKNKEFLERK